MKNLYLHLAADGIRKNRQLYRPYILTCICMVMIFYILGYLAHSPLVAALRGGESVGAVLALGTVVMGVFSAIFLFYTHSFLIRRRHREFGLYNVLGMSRRDLRRIVTWESVLSGALSLAAGLVLGIALSKLGEMLLIRVMGGENVLTFTVSVPCLWQTALVFCGIFGLIWAASLVRLGRATAAGLLKSTAQGEKPPRANCLLAIPGGLLLAAAYGMAVSVKDPVEAMTLFFLAVVMVILATYLLMTAGSVTLCRTLQKNKAYYYRPEHFVSVSSMAYRMKRNGAGLASICILVTMVLVTVSSTSCLYFGAADTIRSRYPREQNLHFRMESAVQLREDNIAQLRASAERAIAEAAVKPHHVQELRYISLTGLFAGDTLQCDHTRAGKYDMDDLRDVFFVSAADYNALAGTDLTLRPGEAAVFTHRCKFPHDTLRIENFADFAVKTVAADKSGLCDLFEAAGGLVVAVEDITNLPWEHLRTADGGELASCHWRYGFDTGLTGEQQQRLALDLEVRITFDRDRDFSPEGGFAFFTADSRSHAAADFYGIYGGLFFLGIMLSCVFLTAAVLILYYKQVSEGYEDQSRFAIMQKVGMTRKEIQRSIRSQLLVVFFLPLGAAVVHLGFAFPMIRRILFAFGLNNLWLFALTTGISIGVFGLLYLAVYRATSGVYYRIVAESRDILRT